MSHPINSSAIPFLFGKRRPAEPTTAAQYVGTDTEIDPKDATVSCCNQAVRQPPFLFDKRLPAEPTMAAQYIGTDTELDPKDGGAASCHDGQSLRQFPFLFGERRPAEPTMAAQYIGTDTELDTKGPIRSVPGSSPGGSPESASVQIEMTSPTPHA